MRILVVNDDLRLREAIVRAVCAAGDMAVVGSFGTPADGRRLLLEVQPDVPFVDLWVSDDDGIDLILLASGLVPYRDAMVVTIICDEPHMIASIEAGATG